MDAFAKSYDVPETSVSDVATHHKSGDGGFD
jgi:hypothetical protein